MMSFFTPKTFLVVGGTVLLALGILGLITWNAGVIKENSIFYLDNGENVSHIVLGAVALILAAVLGSQQFLQKWVVVLVGIVALFFGLYGFAVSGSPMPNTFGVANLENPLDNVLHLVVGVWALVSSFMQQAAKA